MVQDGLRYDTMVEEALRGVVREALSLAAEHGLPGDHHFYITFRTDFPGISLPASLRKRYPSEMTIVLQHQYWGLEVSKEGFAVTLSFNDKLERLDVPLSAVTAFADPSVRFGLQFDGHDGEDEDEGALTIADLSNEDGKRGDSGDLPEAEEARPEAAEADAGDGSANVVTLDAFRKK
ncbi:MAG: ClpXP protease specificity-enhancing factor SspB [Kiloniellales bacterium]|nr:ClpXP protease specificity-enhancing factor SspB [Kiloniellales bacterium]